MEILSPNNITVSWHGEVGNGSGTVNEDLSYFLLYSPDAGKNWHTVGVNIKDSQVTLHANRLPGGDQARFRLIASDGVNTAIADSNGTFIVPIKPPEPEIIFPSNNSTYPSGQTVIFVGKAFDREDGSLYNESALR